MEVSSRFVIFCTVDCTYRERRLGVSMGRKPKLTDHQKREAIKRRDHGEETLAAIGRSYNVSGWTISRLRAPSFRRVCRGLSSNGTETRIKFQQQREAIKRRDEDR